VISNICQFNDVSAFTDLLLFWYYHLDLFEQAGCIFHVVLANSLWTQKIGLATLKNLARLQVQRQCCDYATSSRQSGIMAK